MVKATPPHTPHAEPIPADVAALVAGIGGEAVPASPVGGSLMGDVRAAAAAPSRFSVLTSDTFDEIEGADLERDKAALEGIPFIITSVTVRDGVMRDGAPTNYVSAEITVADRATLFARVKAGRITQEQAARVDPDAQLVINDGGTGICRQLVQYLAAKGMISVPGGPDGGPMGESRYDIHYGQWGYNTPGTAALVANNEGAPRFDVRLLCGRGLRSSEYTADATGKDALTWYIA